MRASDPVTGPLRSLTAQVTIAGCLLKKKQTILTINAGRQQDGAGAAPAGWVVVHTATVKKNFFFLL